MTPSALERLRWLENQFAQQLAAVETTDFRAGWQRHLDAVHAGIDAIEKLDAVTRERDEARAVAKAARDVGADLDQLAAKCPSPIARSMADMVKTALNAASDSAASNEGGKPEAVPS